MQVFIRTHDNVGIGRLSRGIALARRIGCGVVAGTRAACGAVHAPDVDVRPLPGDLDERKKWLRERISAARDGAVICDCDPAGVQGDMIDALKAHTGVSVLVLRDYLGTVEQVARAWSRDNNAGWRALNWYDQIWVAAPEDVPSPLDPFVLPHDLKRRVRHVGYIG